MAKSAAHKWGQMIGDLLQLSWREELQKVADRNKHEAISFLRRPTV
jgi:hypothetical protein